MAQSFCAQPEIIEFTGGKGIRYLSYYSQGLNPVLDYQVFYTFQGLTDDGQYYVSVVLPVVTGIFPVVPPDCPRCGESDYDMFGELRATLETQLDQLNSLEETKFSPTLSLLDELVRSIRIE
jgi:hypothetical protein